MSAGLGYQIGAVLVAVAIVALAVSRERLPEGLRRPARYATGVLLAVLVGMAAVRFLSPVRPVPKTLDSTMQPKPGVTTPVVKATVAKAPATAPRPRPQVMRPKIREIGPEETERLLEQIRTRKEIPIGR